MKIYYPPFDIYTQEGSKTVLKDKDGFSVFLGGSIEMGNCENWQNLIMERFKNNNKVIFLNPRRPDWDPSWEQRIDNPYFKEQVDWELNGLEACDFIVFYFDPKTKAPITLMELGLYARSKKVIVCCPDGYWRKGNVDVVCERHCIEQVETIEDLIEEINGYI